MAAVVPAAASRVAKSSLRWLPVVLGLIALYAPTIYYLNATHWDDEEHAHGPIILLAAMWMFWQQRTLLFASEDRPALASGAVLLTFGLLCYVLGRSQAVIALEVASIIPVVGGALLFIKGWRALFALSFPLMYLTFMVPLPGFILIPLTGPLREYVSVIAEAALRALDYPIARSGVILNIGAYQLLVANACSGINSMFALTALGLLYLHLMGYRSAWRNGILLASILPIAFAANIVRVVTLVLVTYHFGDAAGQGVIHGLSGMGLFIIALGLLFILDATLGATAFRRKG
jgi:exosortase B